MRRFGWLELGFTEEYILRLFMDMGSVARRIDCKPSVLGTGYIFHARGDKLLLSDQWFPDELDAGWNNPEAHGRWTKTQARILIDTTNSFRSLEIDAQNHHPVTQTVEFRYGSSITSAIFRAGERKTVVIDATHKAPELSVRTRSHIPAKRYIRRNPDTRSLGILIRSIANAT